MNVWMMRHGESETNRDGLWTGHLDVRLTETGKMQAMQAGKYLAGIQFDRVFSSDLQRAKMTAELAAPGCRVEFLSALREIDVGSLAGTSYSDLTDEKRNTTVLHGYSAFGGESKTDFRNRVYEYMKTLEEQECCNIAVFTHAGWMRRFFELAVGVPFPNKSICCGNCATAIYEFKNGSWKLHSWMNL